MKQRAVRAFAFRAPEPAETLGARSVATKRSTGHRALFASAQTVRGVSSATHMAQTPRQKQQSQQSLHTRSTRALLGWRRSAPVEVRVGVVVYIVSAVAAMSVQAGQRDMAVWTRSLQEIKRRGTWRSFASVVRYEESATTIAEYKCPRTRSWMEIVHENLEHHGCGEAAVPDPPDVSTSTSSRARAALPSTLRTQA